MLHPMQEFIRDETAVRFEELVAYTGVGGDRDVEFLLMYVAGDREPYERELQATDSVRWYDLTRADDHSFYVFTCQETRPEDVAWRSAFVDRNLVAVPPIRYDSNAGFHVTVVGVDEDLKRLLADLPNEISVTVEAVGEYSSRHDPITGGLTPRQHETIETAVAVGYYDRPRTGSLDAVADRLQCAPSTASDLLLAAESKIMKKIAAHSETK
jgi:predicted DNA binding protein